MGTDELKVRPFYEKRMGQEVDAETLGDEFKGYVVRITGGNDKQGFPMKQGVLTNQRVRLLLGKGQSCYRPRRDGERKRKSVRGCIVDGNLAVLSMAIVKKGEKNRLAAAEYAKILAQRQKEAKEAKELKRKRSASLRESKRSVSSQ